MISFTQPNVSQFLYECLRDGYTKIERTVDIIVATTENNDIRDEKQVRIFDRSTGNKIEMTIDQFEFISQKVNQI